MEQNPLIETGLPIALTIIMVGIGLSLTRKDFSAQLRSPRATVVGLVGQLVLVPLVGLGVAAVFNLSPLLALGLVLVAATPGGATSNLITYLARGNVALSIILTAVASIAVIGTLPLWMDIAARIIPGVDGVDVSVPLGQTFGLLLGVVLIPVLLGMVLRAKKPALADRLQGLVGIVGITVLVLLIIGIAYNARDRLVDLLIQVGPAVIVLNLAVVIMGGLLAWVFRLGRPEQLAIAVEFGIKNTTLGLLIAYTVIGDHEVGLASAIYSLVMYVSMFAIVWLGRRMIADPAQAPAVSGPGDDPVDEEPRVTTA